LRAATALTHSHMARTWPRSFIGSGKGSLTHPALHDSFPHGSNRYDLFGPRLLFLTVVPRTTASIKRRLPRRRVICSGGRLLLQLSDNSCAPFMGRQFLRGW
jgi:hypothetical protein